MLFAKELPKSDLVLEGRVGDESLRITVRDGVIAALEPCSPRT